MKKHILILTALLLNVASALAQGDNARKVDFTLMVGLNIGATTPYGVPEEIRSIGGYNPLLNPALGVRATKMLSDKWGVAAALMYEMKGMKANVETRNHHLTLDIHEGDEVDTKTGYYTGSIQNKTRLGMLTLPVNIVWKPSDNWQLTGGMYASYIISREFTGKVSGGRIRETPLTPLIGITRADYDYSADINRFDCGVTIGAARRLTSHLSAEANVRCGFLNMLNSDRRKVDMNTYNVYLLAGLAYDL